MITFYGLRSDRSATRDAGWQTEKSPNSGRFSAVVAITNAGKKLNTVSIIDVKQLAAFPCHNAAALGRNYIL